MSWHFLERWLERANQHATLVGKFWITFLIVCRMVIVASIGDRVYADEQSEFKCNVGPQPGCENVCFNTFSPISHLRFWSFQILAAALPSVCFVIYSGHKSKEKDKLSKLEAKENKHIKSKSESTMAATNMDFRHVDPKVLQGLLKKANNPQLQAALQNGIKNNAKTKRKRADKTPPPDYNEKVAIEGLTIIKTSSKILDTHFGLYVINVGIRLILEIVFFVLQNFTKKNWS